MEDGHEYMLTRCFLFSLLFKAGIPDGVLNVVPGFGSIAGAAISSHMDIDAVICVKRSMALIKLKGIAFVTNS